MCVTASTCRRVVPVPKVRDAIQLVERDGWYLARTRGSHRQFKHATKRGTVTVPGKPSKDLPPGLWRAILRQAGLTGLKGEH